MPWLVVTMIGIVFSGLSLLNYSMWIVDLLNQSMWIVKLFLCMWLVELFSLTSFFKSLQIGSLSWTFRSASTSGSLSSLSGLLLLSIEWCPVICATRYLNYFFNFNLWGTSLVFSDTFQKIFWNQNSILTFVGWVWTVDSSVVLSDTFPRYFETKTIF